MIFDNDGKGFCQNIRNRNSADKQAQNMPIQLAHLGCLVGVDRFVRSEDAGVGGKVIPNDV